MEAGHPPSAESIVTELEKILASESFARSQVMSRFLRFCVERALQGEAKGLKEYLIGAEVFRRGESYDPRIDPIVRVEACRLRSKLREYYNREGQKDHVVIEFPKGGYGPVFREPKPHRQNSEPAAGQQQSAEKTAIAVLPLADLSAQKDQESFCHAIADELITALAKVEELRVVSRTSSFQFGAEPHDIREIARRLRVGSILQGSVQKMGDRVRVMAQLIEADTGFNTWSQIYDREMKDVFVIEDEICHAIVDALRIELLQEHPARLVKQPTENLQAYNFYSQGRYYQERLPTEGALNKSIDYFRQAIAEDRNCASAYAGLAESYVLVALYGASPARDAMPAAKAAAARALEIDGTLAAGHATLGIVRCLYDWDWAGAEQEILKALELEPVNANACYWRGHYLECMGRLEEAMAEMMLAHELDPLSPVINMNVALTFYLNRRYGEAIDQSRKTIELEPNFPGGYWSLGMALEQERNYKGAIEAMQTAATLSGGLPWLVGSLGHCYAVSGQRELAVRVLEELLEASKRRHVSQVSIAMIHIGLGDYDRAFECLNAAYQQRDGRLLYLNVTSLYDPVRGDPRFDDLVRHVGLGPAGATRLARETMLN